MTSSREAGTCASKQGLWVASCAAWYAIRLCQDQLVGRDRPVKVTVGQATVREVDRRFREGVKRATAAKRPDRTPCTVRRRAPRGAANLTKQLVSPPSIA